MRTCKNVFVSRSGSCLKYKEKRADARAVNVRTTAYGAQVLDKGCTAQGCRYWAAAATGARAAAPIGSATYVQNWIVHLKNWEDNLNTYRLCQLAPGTHFSKPSEPEQESKVKHARLSYLRMWSFL